jgi:hypothetical protein
VLDALSRHKAEIVALLRPRQAENDGIEQRRGPVPAAQDDTWTDAEEERAAIAEYDGGAPRAWAEALARLDPNKPPSDVPPQRWLRFIDDCGPSSTVDGPHARSLSEGVA